MEMTDERSPAGGFMAKVGCVNPRIGRRRAGYRCFYFITSHERRKLSNNSAVITKSLALFWVFGIEMYELALLHQIPVLNSWLFLTLIE